MSRVCIVLGLVGGVVAPVLAAETFVLAPRLIIVTCSDGVRQQVRMTPIEVAYLDWSSFSSSTATR